MVPHKITITTSVTRSNSGRCRLGGERTFRPFVVRDFIFLRLQAEFFLFFCFQVSFCPVKRGNRPGSSRNESDYSRRGTQISFPISFALLDCRSCKNFGLYSSFFNFLARKKVVQTAPPFWSTVSFLTTQLKNELVQHSRNCDSREAEHWPGYLS